MHLQSMYAPGSELRVSGNGFELGYDWPSERWKSKKLP